MNIPIGTLGVLLVLLPGFVFFTGVSSADRFARETLPRNPVSLLAATLLVSAGIHIGLVLTYTIASGWISIAPAGLVAAQSLLASDKTGTERASEITSALQQSWPWLSGYFLVAVGLGFLAGRIFGAAIARRWPFFRKFSQHDWVYQLRIHDGRNSVSWTWAVFLLDLKENEKVVTYAGRLHAFGLGADGRLTYAVLRNAERFYYYLDGDQPHTGAADARRLGITSSRTHRGASLDASFLFIEGKHIINAVFDNESVPIDRTGLEDLEAQADWKAGLSKLAIALTQLGTTISPVRNWRANIMANVDGVIRMHIPHNYPKSSPELDIALNPGEGFAGHAIADSSTHWGPPDRPGYQLTPEQGLRLSKEVRWIVSVPLCRQADGTSLAALNVDILEDLPEQQVEPLVQALERTAKGIDKTALKVFERLQSRDNLASRWRRRAIYRLKRIVKWLER